MFISIPEIKPRSVFVVQLNVLVICKLGRISCFYKIYGVLGFFFPCLICFVWGFFNEFVIRFYESLKNLVKNESLNILESHDRLTMSGSTPKLQIPYDASFLFQKC